MLMDPSLGRATINVNVFILLLSFFILLILTEFFIYLFFLYVTQGILILFLTV